MRELQLFAEYLKQLRQERLQLCQTKALLLTEQNWAEVKALASEGELIYRILVALRELDKDSGAFVRQYLQEHHLEE